MDRGWYNVLPIAWSLKGTEGKVKSMDLKIDNNIISVFLN